MKISKRTVDALKAPEKDTVVWDDTLMGFGVRLRSGGSKTFLAQYRNAQGKVRRVTLGRYGKLTADEARRAAQEVLAKAALKQDPVQERQAERVAITVEDLCRDYLAQCNKGFVLGRGGKAKKASTLATDDGRIERHIIPLLGRKLARDVTTADVKAFMLAVAEGKTATVVKTKERGKAVVTGGMGTARRTLGLLGGIFSFALEHGHATQNPVRGVKRGADGQREFRLSPEEYRAYGKAVDAAENDGEHWQSVAIARLLALTGCRLGEIVRLEKTEVDRHNRCLRLADNKVRGAVIPLGEPALAILATCLERSHPDSAFVFPGVRNPKSAFGDFPNVWERFAGRKFTPHGLRHAFGSTCDDLGMGELTIAALLGHRAARKGSTTRGYIHKIDTVLLAEADRAARHISRAMNGETADIIAMPARQA